MCPPSMVISVPATGSRAKRCEALKNWKESADIGHGHGHEGDGGEGSDRRKPNRRESRTTGHKLADVA